MVFVCAITFYKREYLLPEYSCIEQKIWSRVCGDQATLHITFLFARQINSYKNKAKEKTSNNIRYYLYTTRNVTSKPFAGKEIVIILLLPCCNFCMPIREKNSYFYVWLLDDRSWWLWFIRGIVRVYEYDKCLSMSDWF